jgi:molecular chaperone GrpE
MSKKDPVPDFVKKNMSENADSGSADKPSTTSKRSADELEEMLEDVTAQMEDYKNQVMRLHAEMDNLRKRSEKDIAKAHKYGLDRFAADLLPIVDSLEHGLNIDIGDNEFAKNVHDGMKMTLNLFLNTLEKFSIEQVNPIDDPFSPELHQAMCMEENTEVPANTVLKVMQKGYTLNGRLIRPALVTVSK